MKEFDLVVVGGGPGGYVAAIRGAQSGAKVALVERDKVGGTCLNRGCIPTKALYYSAKALKATRHAQVFGVGTGEISFDMAKAIERKDGVVTKLVGGVEQLLKGNGVELFKGDAAIGAGGRITIKGTDEAKELGAKATIIATGSEPALIPAFSIDGKNVLTSTEALNLKEVPKSMLIIGGGVMGCEFATIYSAFGCKVTIVELLPTILSTEDRAVVRVIAKGFKASGVEVLTDVMVAGVEVIDGSVKTILKDGREFVTEKVLVSIGRSFNSTGFGLEELGVKTDKGRIVVNDSMETNVNGLYAIGDVTGRMLLAHIASVHGGIAAANALGGNESMDYSAVPAGIFTDPEIASVGLREREAKEREIEVEIGRFPYLASGKALGMDETDGFCQIVAEKGSDRILGCTIVGAHATDLLGEVTLAVKSKMKVADIIETIHAHPTLPEIVLEAAEDAHGKAIHKMGRKRK